MSYTQFGYTTQLVVGSSSPTSPVPCCDAAGRPSAATSPYESPRLLSACPRLTAGFYSGSTGYPSAESATAAYPVDASSFYPTLNPAYPTMKDNGDPWRGAPTSYYYDPTLSAAYGYSSFDFNATRRKNVTRDSTTTLKAWLNEHRKNPYPTKGEKIMLAIITKMTLTQVSTWFANARRRLKKENKMTWEPRNKMEDEEKNSDDGEDVDAGHEKDDAVEQGHHGIESAFNERSVYTNGAIMHPGSDLCLKERLPPTVADPYTPNSDSSSPDPSEKEVKPKIWSLADTATSKTEVKECTSAWFHRPSLYGSAPPQTDTPPQTPPNMHHGNSMAYLSTPYLTQCVSNPVYTATAYTCMSVHEKASGLYPVSYRTEYPLDEYQ